MSDRSTMWVLFVIALLMQCAGMLLILVPPTHEVLGMLAFFGAVGIAVRLGTWSNAR